MDTGLDGSDRDVQEGGDLLVGTPLQAQLENGPQMRRQMIDVPQDTLRGGMIETDRFRRGGRIDKVVPWEERAVIKRFGIQAENIQIAGSHKSVAVEVMGDADRPGIERGLALKGVQTRVDPDQRPGGNILRVGLVAAQGPGISLNRIEIAAH